MEKYQQFKFRQGMPGVDYDMYDCGIEGSPTPLKEAVSEVAEAQGLLELGDAQQAANILGGILRRHGLPGECDHPEILPGGFQGCKGMRFAIELYGRRERQREAKKKQTKAREKESILEQITKYEER